MTELILVVNFGSTSIKADLVDPKTGDSQAALSIERLGSGQASVQINHASPSVAPDNPAQALKQFLPNLLNRQHDPIRATAHRVVHGGDEFTEPTLVSEQVLEQLDQLSHLAPLHNPPAINGIRIVSDILPDLPHFAVFDTGFHQSIPLEASTYALPTTLLKRHKIRRFGFHGISHEFTVEQVAAYLQVPSTDLKVVSCHLGGGCSVCAVDRGKSVASSMGMTPLEGLVMSTRCGDLDPAIPLMLQKVGGYSVDEVEDLLTRRSGLFGLTGGVSDFRDIERAARQGNHSCRQAIDLFCHRLLQSIGSHLAVMNHADALVFTGGIGENSHLVRQRICERLSNFGIQYDHHQNEIALSVSEQLVTEVTSAGSQLRVFVSRSNEAWAIAKCAFSHLNQ